jgi:hypothetical protein
MHFNTITTVFHHIVPTTNISNYKIRCFPIGETFEAFQLKSTHVETSGCLRRNKNYEMKERGFTYVTIAMET